MPVNPQAQVVLDMMAATGFKLVGDPVAVREMLALTPRPHGEPVASVQDRTITANGAQIPVRVYRPESGPAVKPALSLIHI